MNNHPFYSNPFPKQQQQSSQSQPTVISNDFIDTVKQYIEFDNQVHEGRLALKQLQDRRQATENILIQYMSANHMEDKEFSLTDGKLRFGMSRSTAPVNKEHILQRLQVFLKNKELAEKATDYIFADRQVTFTPKLKRTMVRNKTK
jgi:hypothetical protein